MSLPIVSHKKSNGNNDDNDDDDAFEECLATNLRMQEELSGALQSILTMKQRNRREAYDLMQELGDCWCHRDAQMACAHLDHLHQASNSTTTDSEEHTIPTTAAKRRKIAGEEKKSRYDESRKWTRRYFVDWNGSCPDPNPDLLLRRQLEAEAAADEHMPTGPPLFARPPWSKKEVERLRVVAEQVRQSQMQQRQQQQQQGTDDTGSHLKNVIVPDAEIDFAQVAENLADDGSKKKRRRRKAETDASGVEATTTVVAATSRSPAECRLQFLCAASPSISNDPFTKQESLRILELCHEHHGHPPWDLVAWEVSNKRRKDQEKEREQGAAPAKIRTAFQCFRHYQTKLNPHLKSRPWTAADDELLLKYIAACGSAFVLNRSSAADIAARLFPDRSGRQVLLRANASLVNPHYVHEAWTPDEERKLALCHKIYRDAPSPLTKACLHFPHRASKSVAEKWNRSLNPDFSFRPFDAQEDDLLLQVVSGENTSDGDVGSSSATKNWAQVAREHFPDRNARSLKYRWMELADARKVLSARGEAVKTSKAARRGMVGKGDNSGFLLSPDDFVVRRKQTAQQRRTNTHRNNNS